MNYEDRICCFIDILGFARRVEETISPDGSDATQDIEAIADALECIRITLDIDRPEDRIEYEVTQFSDSVVVSFSATAESGVFYALLYILWVQINLVLRGILIRGGIARGRLIHTDKFLFGPAMVDAYKLESEKANFPRVILDKGIVQAGVEAHGEHHFPEHEESSILSIISEDEDKFFYIDYITKAKTELDDPECDYPDYLSNLRNIISIGLNEPDKGIVQKYEWMNKKILSLSQTN